MQDNSNWSRNIQGRIYHNGSAGEEALWENIRVLHTEHPDWTGGHIAEYLRCSPGLVSKVFKRERDGEVTPRKHGPQQLHNPRPHTFSNFLPIFQSYLEEGTPVGKLAAKFYGDTGETFHSSTVYKNVGKHMNLTPQVGMRVDPRKFTDENMEYYLSFLDWRMNLSLDDILGIKTFDECRVDQTSMFVVCCLLFVVHCLLFVVHLLFSFYVHSINNTHFIDLGKVKVWAVRGETPVVEGWKKSAITQSYTVTILTTLTNDPPLAYNIIEGNSNAQYHLNFFSNTAQQHIHEGDTVLGDNLNYHCYGWSADCVQLVVRDKKARYTMQPKVKCVLFVSVELTIVVVVCSRS